VQAQCTLRATPHALTLRAEAASEENLRRVQDIIASDIERFGKREDLQVVWQRPPPRAPATQPSQASKQPVGRLPVRRTAAIQVVNELSGDASSSAASSGL